MDTAHLIERFRALPRNDEMRVLWTTYAFDGEGKDFVDEWKVKLYRTQIPHIDGGANRKPQGDVVDLELAYSMVREGLADVVYHLQDQVPKKRMSSFGSPGLPRITVVGTPKRHLRHEKVVAIESLWRKMRWETRRENRFNFAEFWGSVASVVEESPSAAVSLIDDGRQVRDFLGKCDDRVISAIPDSDLSRLLASIGVSKKEWLRATQRA